MFNYKVGEPGEDFELLPAGTYTVRIESVDQKLSKKGRPFLQLKTIVMDPFQYRERIINDFFGLDHDDENVKLIQEKTLNRFCIDILGKQTGDSITERDFPGVVLMLHVEHETGLDGKVQLRVKKREALKALHKVLPELHKVQGNETPKGHPELDDNIPF